MCIKKLSEGGIFLRINCSNLNGKVGFHVDNFEMIFNEIARSFSTGFSNGFPQFIHIFSIDIF